MKQSTLFYFTGIGCLAIGAAMGWITAPAEPARDRTSKPVDMQGSPTERTSPIAVNPAAIASVAPLAAENPGAVDESIEKAVSYPSYLHRTAALKRYFDALLAWNRETGWDEMIEITIWRTPIYEEGKDLTEAMTKLRKVIAQGKPYAAYTSIDEFFTPIAGRLRQKYAADSVMVGCIEPFKLALVQGW